MDYPDTNFVIAHGGCPWFVDAAEVIYKNANVWADLSGIFVGDATAFAVLAALRAPHRRQGLALASLQASLDDFLAHDHPRPDVYCWVYSEDGRRLLPALRRWLAAVEAERQGVSPLSHPR